MSGKRLFTVILFLVLGCTLVQPASAERFPQTDYAGSTRDRLRVTLAASETPNRGDPVTLTFQATPLEDAQQLVVRWILPDGVAIQGELESTLGPVAAGETVTVEREVTFQEFGVYKVAVDAGYSPHPSAKYGAAGVLFFSVGRFSSSVTTLDPATLLPDEDRLQMEVVTASPAAARSAQGSGCFNIDGSLRRMDKVFHRDMSFTWEYVPARYVVVELWESDTLFDDHYRTTVTDEDGNFQFSQFCDDDGWFDDRLELYVEIPVKAKIRGYDVGYVEDSSWLDEMYVFKSPNWGSTGGSHSFHLEPENENGHAKFNILDAVVDAWLVWDHFDSVFDYEAEVHWEPGYGDDGSYYEGFVFDEITIADDPSDPDQWDDSVIIHEWGHFADDKYGCDDNPGGAHYFDGNYDPELSWGEGYPDYWQSAVRQWRGDTWSSYYLDANGAGGGVSLDLETWDVLYPNNRTVRNEMAIAATLWDLNDAHNDGQDRVALGHQVIQDIYTSDAFANQYWLQDDNCTARRYFKAWLDTGQQADVHVAAAVEQNIGITSLYPTAQRLGEAIDLTSAGDATALTTTEAGAPQWWQQAMFIVDDSASMGVGSKLDAVKLVLGDVLNSTSQVPEGVEIALNTFNESTTKERHFEGIFYQDLMQPYINNLSAQAGTDAQCETRSLPALWFSIVNRLENGDVWLMTDGDSADVRMQEAIQRYLNDQHVRASFMLLGNCSNNAVQQEPAEVEALRNQASSLLEVSVAETPSGILPYLTTAIGSGGQFLFVAPGQEANAAEIINAQRERTVGAGRWSDYVSHEATYRWDRLTSWEYNWIDAANTGTSAGFPGGASSEGYVTASLPGPFPFFGVEQNAAINVMENGLLSFTTGYGPKTNTAIPNSSAPNGAMYVFWDDLEYYFNRQSEDTERAALAPWYGGIYTKQVGDWFAIEYYKYRSTTSEGKQDEHFQVLLNMDNGEIRYQYNTTHDGAAGATVGLEDGDGSIGVQVAYNDAGEATSGTGYKFVPVPAQPTKTYDVEVDSQMEGLGVLLTTFSGQVEPMVVRYPDGTAVDCSDSANVICMTLDQAQYVQADSDGRNGTWRVEVSAAANQSATFSLSTMTTSALSPFYLSGHDFPLSGGQALLIDMGMPVDGNVLQATFQTMNGTLLGGAFQLLDDGEHGDGAAGDGIFGAADFPVPGAGSAYLRLTGKIRGEAFTRFDPVPYRFQPIRVVETAAEFVDYGTGVPVTFNLYNEDQVDHCYHPNVRVPEGWLVGRIRDPMCVTAGGSLLVSVPVRMESGVALPSGTTGDVVVSMTEVERGEIWGSASVRVTRHRVPASIALYNKLTPIRPGGDDLVLKFLVTDSQGYPVHDSTTFSLRSSAGVISPTSGTTDSGYVEAVFTSDAAENPIVTISAGSAFLNVPIEIVTDQMEMAESINLTVTPASLNTIEQNASLLVEVRDKWGEPIAGANVVLGVEGDEQMGQVNGQEKVTGTTDSSGRFPATFTPLRPGEVWIRAELLVDQGNGLERVMYARESVSVGSYRQFLPGIVR